MLNNLIWVLGIMVANVLRVDMDEFTSIALTLMGISVVFVIAASMMNLL